MVGETFLVQFIQFQVTETQLKWLNQNENEEEGEDLLMHWIKESSVGWLQAWLDLVQITSSMQWREIADEEKDYILKPVFGLKLYQ